MNYALPRRDIERAQSLVDRDRCRRNIIPTFNGASSLRNERSGLAASGAIPNTTPRLTANFLSAGTRFSGFILRGQAEILDHESEGDVGARVYQPYPVPVLRLEPFGRHLWPNTDSALVAQRIEHWSSEPGVGGSNPSGRATIYRFERSISTFRTLSIPLSCNHSATIRLRNGLNRAIPGRDSDHFPALGWRIVWRLRAAMREMT